MEIIFCTDDEYFDSVCPVCGQRDFQPGTIILHKTLNPCPPKS